MRELQCIVGAALCLCAASPAVAVDLAGAPAAARFVDRDGTEKDRGFLRVAGADAITAPLPDPTLLPSSVWVFSETSGVTELPLDASRWRRVRRGYRYLDPSIDTGLRVVSLLTGRRGGTLVLRARGSVLGMQPVSEPSNFIEARLRVGETEYCARLEPPAAKMTTNRPDRLAFRGTASPCEVSTRTCSLDPLASQLTMRTGLLVLPLTAAGDLSFTCDSVDPQTMRAACTCDLVFEALNIPAIGDVCITSAPLCGAGALDCAGNTSADVSLVADHNIGTCTDPEDCRTQCDTYCASQGPGYEIAIAACEGFCVGGSSDGAPCSLDDDCPGAICAGPDGGEPSQICECSCNAAQLGGAASPASLACATSLAISIELDESGVCGDFPPTVVMQPGCMNLTTAQADAVLFNVGNSPGIQIGPLSTAGVAPSCPGLAAGTVSATMVGHFATFGTAIGDVLIENELVCQE